MLHRAFSHRVVRWSFSGFVVLACLALWQMAGACQLINTKVIPEPSVAVAALAAHWQTGDLQQDILASLARVWIGFAIGGTCGVACGLVCLRTWPRRLLRPILAVIQGIPLMAWIPIAILVLGLGNPPAYFLVSLGVFFPTFSGTYLGFSSTERQYALAAQTLGFTKWQTLRQVALPQALPSILAGLRVGMGVAWMALVTVELVSVQTGGLGYLLQISRAQLQTDVVVGVMALVGLLGMSCTGLIRICEWWLLPWRFTGRELLTSES